MSIGFEFSPESEILEIERTIAGLKGTLENQMNHLADLRARALTVGGADQTADALRQVDNQLKRIASTENGIRLWRLEIQKLRDEINLRIVVDARNLEGYVDSQIRIDIAREQRLAEKPIPLPIKAGAVGIALNMLGVLKF